MQWFNCWKAGLYWKQFENIEVILTCCKYVSEQSRWPTMAEIAATSGLPLSNVLDVDRRLRGIYEFALWAGLVQDSS